MTVAFPRADFIIPASLVTFGVIMDIFTTFAALSLGLSEKNPMTIFLIACFGLTEFMIFKFVVSLGLILLLGFVAWRRQHANLTKYVRYGLWLLFVAYLFVVLSNLQALIH